jgi:hypothetical protein
MKKVRRKSHQVQVDRQNQQKQKEINSQAHMRATNLVNAEQKKPASEPRCSTQKICTNGMGIGGVKGVSESILWLVSYLRHLYYDLYEIQYSLAGVQRGLVY